MATPNSSGEREKLRRHGEQRSNSNLSFTHRITANTVVVAVSHGDARSSERGFGDPFSLSPSSLSLSPPRHSPLSLLHELEESRSFHDLIFVAFERDER
jgi:hypothetical protein